MSIKPRVMSHEQSIEQRRENIGHIRSAVKTCLQDFDVESAFGIGLQIGVEEEVSPLDLSYGIRGDGSKTRQGVAENFVEYRQGLAVGRLLGMAHNIGSVYPVEETQ